MKKSKIIALLMATACAATVFAGCDKDATCKKHADADKNGYCDSCKQAVITITEQLPAEKEEVVEMVVNPIPTGVKASEYIGPKSDAETALLKGVELLEVFEGKSVLNRNTAVGLYALGTRETVSDDGTTKTYKNVMEVYSAIAKKVIYTCETEAYAEGESPLNNVELTLNNYYFKAVEARWIEGTTDEPMGHYEYKTVIYSIAGDKMYETNTGLDDYDVWYKDSAGYTYIEVEDKLFVVDQETEKLVTIDGVPTDPNFYVKRPDFDEVKGNYGYVFENDTVWVYDLTKWISCVYYMQIPSYWMDYEMLVLDNGKLLVQYKKTLPDSAVNYDVQDGVKMDLVQMIIDPATGEATEKELGYMVKPLDGYDLGKYNDKAKNVVYLIPIEYKAFNDNARFEAVIDSDLNILYAHKPTLVGQDLYMFEYVAENVYRTTIDYGSGVTVDMFVDGEGKEIAKIPTNASSFAGLVWVGDKVYDYDIKTVLLELSEYDDYEVQSDYAILTKEVEVEDDSGTTTVTEYYFYKPGMNAPTKIDGEVLNAADPYYVVKVEKEVTTDEGTETVVEYVMYNALNEKVATFDADISNFRGKEKGDVWIVSLSNGETVYIGR